MTAALETRLLSYTTDPFKRWQEAHDKRVQEAKRELRVQVPFEGTTPLKVWRPEVEKQAGLAVLKQELIAADLADTAVPSAPSAPEVPPHQSQVPVFRLAMGIPFGNPVQAQSVGISQVVIRTVRRGKCSPFELDPNHANLSTSTAGHEHPL